MEAVHERLSSAVQHVDADAGCQLLEENRRRTGHGSRGHAGLQATGYCPRLYHVHPSQHTTRADNDMALWNCRPLMWHSQGPGVLGAALLPLDGIS